MLWYLSRACSIAVNWNTPFWHGLWKVLECGEFPARRAEHFFHRERSFFCLAHLLAVSGLVKSQFCKSKTPQKHDLCPPSPV